MAKKAAESVPTKATNKKSAKPAVFQTGADARSAVLIVSLIGNAFFVCLWVALRVTDQYDGALSMFFLNR